MAETGRLTDQRAELDDGEKEAINQRLRLVQESIVEQPEITVTFFLPDQRKAGGEYVTTTGRARKIDGCSRLLILCDGTKIPIEEILQLEGKIVQTPESN